MTAKVHFGGGCEPAEGIAVAVRQEEGCLGLIHLHSHVLKPGIFKALVEKTHASGVPGKGTAFESVDE
jgi:hypothetical protein